MTAAAPWSVKGIDPKAREVAKDLARRAGMTLGEWLNRVILEDDDPEEVAFQSQISDRHARVFAEAPPRPRIVPPAGDMARVAWALERLTDRIEASETRTGMAIAGVEHSVRQALNRIDHAEREQIAVSARVDGATLEQAHLAERVRGLEAGPRSPEALRTLEERVLRAEARAGEAPEGLVEDVLEALGARLAEAEARTSSALDGLKTTLQQLDARVTATEQGADGGRFEEMAQRLSRQVEQARAEFAQKLEAAAGPGMEARLEGLARRLEAAERRSAQAVEQIGHQVVSMADAVNRRLAEADQRGAQAIEQVGGEIARIAGAVEARLSRAEHAQAEALDRLGAEIGRITDKLTERLVTTERRAAQAIDEVGEQVARVTERIEQRHETAARDLSERLRQSEERTSQIFEEARSRLFGERAAARPAADLGQPQPQPQPQPELVVGPFGPEVLARAEADPEVEAEPAGAEVSTFDLQRLRAELPETRAFDPAAEFAPITDEDDVFVDPPAAKPAIDDKPSLSTREVIDQARARAAPIPPRRPEMRARLDGRAATGRMFSGFAPRVRRPNSALQTALMVAGGAAFLSVGAAGVTLMDGPGPASDPSPVYAAAPETSRAAVAIAPTLSAGPAAEVQAPEVTQQLKVTFEEASKAVEAGKAGGLAKLQALAEADYAPAQFYLAQLYQGGRHGVVQNMAEARRWTARAAEGGEAGAMHNLGLYYFRGEGGPQDLASAAQWFRKAAARGVIDSRYNLGLMYQSGSGVQKDAAEAYKWFSLAAAQGDASAAAQANTLKGQLPAGVLRQADAAVAAAKSPAALDPKGTPSVYQR